MAESDLAPFAQATAGALGSIVSNTLVYPLDLISTRFQTETRAKAKAKSSTSIYHALREIFKRDGIKGLYQGLGSDTLSTAISNFLFFYFRSFMVVLFKSRKAKSLGLTGSDPKTLGKVTLNAAEDLAAGALAGIASRFFTTPLSNVTVRKQTSARPRSREAAEKKGATKLSSASSSHQAGSGKRTPGSDSDSEEESTYGDEPGIVDTLGQIIREKGILGLWSGFETAALLSISPALTFYATHAISSSTGGVGESGAIRTFLCSAAGHSVSTTLVFPLILCKTRLQWRSPSGRRVYTSLVDVLGKTIRRGGFSGLYQGLDSQLAKGVLGHGVTMVVKQRVETLFVLVYLLLRRRSKVEAKIRSS
ncbi:mitochondrial carrier [Violaceomyces palustris]|uniref:Mitochondrial carrier n=1 Tax=Violaceomyces palustris TaxID=1673888 RepID=A0ACD0NZ17_9BASI|nr:mitochondrial carrier [Violaceomyces palustris]